MGGNEGQRAESSLRVGGDVGEGREGTDIKSVLLYSDEKNQ